MAKLKLVLTGLVKNFTVKDKKSVHEFQPKIYAMNTRKRGVGGSNSTKRIECRVALACVVHVFTAAGRIFP